MPLIPKCAIVRGSTTGGSTYSRSSSDATLNGQLGSMSPPSAGSPSGHRGSSKPSRRTTTVEHTSSEVKPWGFLAIAFPTTHERARPDGLRSLIGPFERDPARRLAMDWIDRDHPERPAGRIRTSEPHELHEDSAVVLSYGDYFEKYRLHPETKATDPTDGKTCHTWTRGLLHPQHVRATALLRVGKESNRLASTGQPGRRPRGTGDRASSPQRHVPWMQHPGPRPAQVVF
jgi:hypothetical protein